MGDVNEATPEAKVILFYRYTEIPNITDEASTQRALCDQLHLSGRVLLSSAEGANGTLAGKEQDLQKYIEYMKAHPRFKMADSDFKTSLSEDPKPFPDLNIKIVQEIINTGGKFLKDVPIGETGKGYLTPEEWHAEMEKYQNDESAKQNTVLVDVRNHKECQIGGFDGAIDPKTRTFAEMPSWLDNHAKELEGKKVLMYCTGGIRCEKVTAYVEEKFGTKFSGT